MWVPVIQKKLQDSKKINLLRLKLHERIRELVILRLKIMMREKKLIIKTFLYLLLPHNLKFSSKNLYVTIDHSNNFISLKVILIIGVVA